MGGYSQGTITLDTNTKLYIVVGGTSTGYAGGYNGGGRGGYSGYGGGGATHIATTNRGVLSNYNSYRTEILIVVGGGGSGNNDYGTVGTGGSGGGTNGGSTIYNHNDANPPMNTGGTQSSSGKCTNYRYTAGGFGYGAQTGGNTSGGGGGGWYGGTSGDGYWGAGSGGSGYIGGVSDGSMLNGVRSGNGYAKITPVIVYGKASGGTSYRSIDNALLSNLPPYSATGVGNGIFSIKTYNSNIITNTYLNNIIVPDTKSPDELNLGDIYQSEKHIIKWDIPKSNGTEYEFKAKTYKIDYNNSDGMVLIMDTENEVHDPDL